METLVLGGTRFVGLRLVRQLLESGHRVTTLNRGTRDQPYEVESIHADRRRPSQVREALKGRSFDAVFDISAYTPAETGPVVEALQGHVGKFLHISTAAVYGAAKEDPWTEEATLQGARTWGQYAKDKIACESLLIAAREESGFPTIILRPPYIYGPNNYAYREGYFYDRAEARRPIPIPDGEVRVQFCHVDDLAAAFLRAATTSGIEGRVFNVAAKEAVTFREVASYAAEAVGVEAQIVALPDTQVRSLFPFGNFSNQLDISRATTELGFHPRTMKAGLADTYEWYRSHRPFGAPDFSKDEPILHGAG